MFVLGIKLTVNVTNLEIKYTTKISYSVVVVSVNWTDVNYVPGISSIH